MCGYATTTFHDLNYCITNPIPEATQFEFKPMMFQILNLIGQFGGLIHEDPYSYLKPFIEVTNAFRLPGIFDDALRFELFSFSLTSRATLC